MKLAISDGLSESAIMEVIDDVTCLNTSKCDTPRKRRQPIKVDLSRTPRRRPEQLAVGFNYHSDVVVKESPRTVNGQIIPLDTLPTPKERTEQLAMGFGYLADQLVKDSPKTETGEVLIPGVVKTPKRRARDQLAIGFNYHAETMAKENSFVEIPCGKENVVIGNVELDEVKSGPVSSQIADYESNLKSGKKLFSDTIAVGFSYNSNVYLENSLNEIDKNIKHEDFVTDLIEDASLGEGRNLVEVESENTNVPQVGLPAGSVW